MYVRLKNWHAATRMGNDEAMQEPTHIFTDWDKRPKLSIELVGDYVNEANATL